MTQFTSSAKTITYYVETASTRKLEQMYGSRLERLTQQDKNQLCTAIALMLWGCCDSTEGDQDYPDFSDPFEVESEMDLITTQNDQLVPAVSAQVMACLVSSLSKMNRLKSLPNCFPRSLNMRETTTAKYQSASTFQIHCTEN